MVIMAPTLGGTNFLALGRIVGTFFGAGAAVAIWVRRSSLNAYRKLTHRAQSVFPENAVALPLMGALFSVPCFYVIVTRVRPPPPLCELVS